MTDYTKKRLFSNRNSSSNNPLIYKALLTQIGAADPTPTVYSNTLGTITLTRQNTGIFRINGVGLLDQTKRFVFFGILKFVDSVNGVIVESDLGSSDDYIELYTYDEGGLLADGFSNLPVLIEVYP